MTVGFDLENIIVKSGRLIEKWQSCSESRYIDLAKQEQYLSPEASFSKQLEQLNKEIARYVQNDESLHSIDSLALKKVFIPESKILGMKIGELISGLEVVKQCASELFERQTSISSRRPLALPLPSATDSSSSSSSLSHRQRFVSPLESQQEAVEPIQEEQTLDEKILNAIKTNEMTFVSKVARLSDNALRNIDSSVFDQMFEYLVKRKETDLLKPLLHLRNGRKKKLSDDCFFKALKKSFSKNHDIYVFLVAESLNERSRTIKWKFLLKGFVKIGFKEGLVDILSRDNYLAKLSKIPVAQAIHRAFFDALKQKKYGLLEVLSRAAADLGFPINQNKSNETDLENSGSTTVNNASAALPPPSAVFPQFNFDPNENSTFLGNADGDLSAPLTFVLDSEPFQDFS